MSHARGLDSRARICLDGGMTHNTQYTTAETIAPYDVIRSAPTDDSPWMRVLATLAYEVAHLDHTHQRVSITMVPLAYEGYPGGHWGLMVEADHLVERICDPIPTVLHPIHDTDRSNR